VVLTTGKGTPIENANIKINNTSLQTDSNGFFQALVPIADNYTFLTEKNGYLTYGQSYLNAKMGGKWYMRKLEERKIDTGKDVVLESNGATLTIPAGSLVDGGGSAPTNSILGTFTLLNMGEGEFPGDFMGTDGERNRALISYGMVDVNFYDEKGKSYNLKQGVKAQVSIPIEGRENKNVLKNAPKEIPLWIYNESSGNWDQHSTASINRSTLSYEGEVSHFSTINMDQPGPATCIRVLCDPILLNKYLKVSDVSGDGIDYGTVKIRQLDDPLSAIYRIPPGQKIRVEVLETATNDTIDDIFIDVFRSDIPDSGWVFNADSNVILAGAAVADLWPDYPYDECPVTIHIKHQPNRTTGLDDVDYIPFFSYKGFGSEAVANNYYATVDRGDDRLTLNDWLTHNGYNVATSPTNAIYGNHPDLTKYFNMAFLNNNDLGSGRDMHFLQREDGTVASYVSNYGDFNQNHANADKAAGKIFLGGDVIATVCMEWSPLDSASDWIDSTGAHFAKEAGPAYSPGYLQKVEDNSVVKFFVYAQVDTINNPTRQIAANLDGYQTKFIPTLCHNCHGGPSLGPDDTTANPFIGVYFRELDYKSYKFSGFREYDALLDDEKHQFRGQNLIVKTDATAKISSQAVKELVDGWYSDGDSTQQLIVPTNWEKSSFPGDFAALDQPEELYLNVVGKSCRTCHVAFDNAVGGYDLGFNHYEEFHNRKGSIAYYIDGTPNSINMPHAAVTHRNFWTLLEPEAVINAGNIVLSGDTIHRPVYLRQYDDDKWGGAINP